MRYLENFESHDLKICSKCGLKKDVSEFYKLRGSTRPECKNCTYKSNRKYRENNRDFIRSLKRKYHNSDIGKETNRKYTKKYRENIPKEVKDKLRLSHKIWCHNQYNSNSRYKLIVSIRNLIGKSFRNQIKSKSTIDILGCSIDEFRIYIENQFTDGMNWGNQGEWHLDHITPISWATNEDEILKLNHYTNFKPMWGTDNIKKGNRFSEKNNQK